MRCHCKRNLLIGFTFFVCVEIPLHWWYSALLSNLSSVFVSIPRWNCVECGHTFFPKFSLSFVILWWISYHLFRFFADLYPVTTTAAIVNLSFYRQYFCLMVLRATFASFVGITCAHATVDQTFADEFRAWIFWHLHKTPKTPLFYLPNWRSLLFFVFFFIKIVVE